MSPNKYLWGNYIITKSNYSKNDSKIRCDIKYPEISFLSNKKMQEHINIIIKAEALKVLNFYSNPDMSFDLDIDYKISLRSKEILSVQYSGVGYVDKAAYPINLFYTTNIDINKGKRLRLKDIVNIDEDFINKFLNGKFKSKYPEQMVVLENLTSVDIREKFQEADSLDNIGNDKQSDVYSYLTTDSLGISIPVIHAFGDHIEFEIKCQDIEDNINFHEGK